MKAWLKKHTVLAIALVVVLVWLIYRKASGSSSSGGHDTPDDAISYGWAVLPAGITGWLEVSPDGKQSIMHDTGWNGDPYSKA
jgi:hypothetical protein